MMDISDEIENLLKTIKMLGKDCDDHIKLNRTSYSEVSVTPVENEIIDVAQINFSDDETWLYKSEESSNVIDIAAWLHEDTEDLKDLDFYTKHFTLMREITKLDSAKKIDSRTYTRPKKRFSRPSLDFNNSHFEMPEPLHNNSFDNNADTCEKTAGTLQNDTIPLNFDLTESTRVFSNIGKGDLDVESFQNMSPPSLVSSSMFSSIMENSYIKNDPVLREIRDTDYTDVILHGCDPTLLKSFTGSCSSVDSDTPEGFLKRSVETTFIKNDDANVSCDSEANALNETFITNSTVILNSNFHKESTGKKSRSFTHLDQERVNSANKSCNKSSSILNNTYLKNAKENLNDTFSIATHNQVENMKNVDLNRTITISDENTMDSNRLNYSKRRSCFIEDAKCDSKFSTFIKQNRRSLGSNDSLNCTSSLSNSSSGKGSSKMLNMAEVDAIVLQQEQSLQQVMSTPKPVGKYLNNLSEYANISPIRNLDHTRQSSDSESSSNDDYRTVGSGSSKSITSANSDSALMINSPKNSNCNMNVTTTLISKNVEIPKKQSNMNRNILYGSYSNLHKAKLMAQQGSQKNLAGTGSKNNVQSNLKNMDVKLKSSYTQLKPVFTNLPSSVVTNSNRCANNVKTKLPDGSLKIAEVAPTLRDHSKSGSVANAKVVSKVSGLPRPVSGIPRPSGASRIPGPQSLRLGIPQSHTSRINVDSDF